jgi:hypothetical protein
MTNERDAGGVGVGVVQRFFLKCFCRSTIYDIFVNCSWVDTRWQQYSTHLHGTQYTDQQNETEYTEYYMHNKKNT